MTVDMLPAIDSKEIDYHARGFDGYDDFAKLIRDGFLSLTSNQKLVLCTTGAENLFDAFLMALPVEARQHYTCNACRKFFDTYGGLVFVTEHGTKVSAIWDFDCADTPPLFFQRAVERVNKLVRDAPVTGIFVTSEKVWGTPETGGWSHFHVNPPVKFVWSNRVKTAYQRAAELKEDFEMVLRALANYPLEIAEQAATITSMDVLYRTEKVEGVAKWFEALHTNLKGLKPGHNTYRNTVWHAVATAPIGFTHINSSMIGTLLDDLKEGLPMDQVKARFAEKMHPLQYQRPQAPPAAGNIKQAEKLVADLSAAGSLRRRYARLEDIQTVWRPKVAEESTPSTGVFADVKPKGRKKASTLAIEEPSVFTPITWVKFQGDVLPEAVTIQYLPSLQNMPYAALITASDMDAPPIVQWDQVQARNPVTWYQYAGNSTPTSWGLIPGKWVDVTAIALQPNQWDQWGGKPALHHGQGIFMLLAGCKDNRCRNMDAALFPEFLKSDFHAIRATIEAYSRGVKMEGGDQGNANGVRLVKGNQKQMPLQVRVTYRNGVVLRYAIDRWD